MGDGRGLRILMTTRALGGGGAERVWKTLAERFAARGDEVMLAVDLDDNPPTYAPPIGPRVAVLGASHLCATRALADLMRDFRPDVAMAAISASCVKLVAAAAMARREVPLVVSYHGFEEHRTGRLAKLAYWGVPVINRRVAGIVAVSDGLHREMVERWGADPRKTRRIYNPATLDLDGAAETAADLAGRPEVVLAVGRLSPEKGMDTLVAAFARMTRGEARLVIAGDGPERGRLERMAADLGIAERITFLGQVSDVRPLYRTARLLAVPSRTEAFGMVLVEALAHGLPVVATACSGPVEILDGGRYGRLVPVDDPAALAAGIDSDLVEPGDPAPRLERARSFSLEAGFGEWADLVEDVVRRPRGGSDQAAA